MLACWDHFSLLLSWHKLFRHLLVGLSSVMVVGGGKTNDSRGWIPTPSLPQRISIKWTLSSQQWLRTRTAQLKPSLLQQRDAGGRGDKQRESDGQPECCERGVCCSFMTCEKFILFALHLFQRKCVCVPHCLDRLFPLTQNEIFVGQCSGPTVHCASACCFLPF